MLSVYVNVTEGAPKVQAHLSPFSEPEESYHAPGLPGSVRASDNSCALTLASAARPCEFPVVLSTGSQPASPSSFKKHANWTVVFPHVPWLCQAQKPAFPRF